MNNTQLYLSIGIPSFLVILAWLSNRADIHRMGDRVDKGLDGLRAEMHKELDGLRAEIAKNSDSLHAEIVKNSDSLRSEMNRQLDGVRGEMVAFRREMHSDMVPLHERVAVVEARTEKL